MKTCTVCKHSLPYEAYHRSKQTKDGYGYRCVECDKKARHKYREENSYYKKLKSILTHIKFTDTIQLN